MAELLLGSLQERIVATLVEKGEATIPELVRYLDANIHGVTTALKTLREKGVVSRRRSEKQRFCYVWRVSEPDTLRLSRHYLH